MKSYGVTMEISPNVPNPHLATKKNGSKMKIKKNSRGETTDRAKKRPLGKKKRNETRKKSMVVVMATTLSLPPVSPNYNISPRKRRSRRRRRRRRRRRMRRRKRRRWRMRKGGRTGWGPK